MLETVAFRFAKADNASCTKAGKPMVLDLINTAVSCLSTVLHYRTSPSSYLTLPWCHLTLPLSLSPSFSLGFIGRARICMSSDAHMLGHFLIVFHIKQPCLMWSCKGTAHVKISGQLGLGRGKADTCLPYKWKVNTPWIKKLVHSKMQHRLIVNSKNIPAVPITIHCSTQPNEH